MLQFTKDSLKFEWDIRDGRKEIRGNLIHVILYFFLKQKKKNSIFRTVFSFRNKCKSDGSFYLRQISDDKTCKGKNTNEK
jgi:hypothetical protein